MAVAAEGQAGSGSSYQRFGPRMITESLRKRFFTNNLPETNRVVYVDNQLLPGDDEVVMPLYPNNRVVSSKYTLLTFLPKNLFEQFRRIANFYFLCVGVIQFMIDTPVTPLTSVLPLVFVISVTAIKQGYEDWLRHVADNEVNLRPATVIRNGKAQTDCRAMDIKVGDIVKVYQNEEFPCDLVLLSSADPQGLCYVTTANLDGETNLKTLFCLSDTRRFRSPEELGELRARITGKPPLADLYTFEGVLEAISTENQAKPLGPENLLLRGARLKNTEHIFGCALYTGKETKMALNSKFKQTKFSQVERKMNTFLIVFLVILLVEIIVSTGLKYWYEDVHGDLDYVPEESNKGKPTKVLENALAFMVLYNYIIPISLYVTIELQKFLGSIFFGFDVKMYDESIDERALANTSDLNEELGQVEYLFTDKTGTLTENTMEFRHCCIGSRQFQDVDGTFCERVHPEMAPKKDITFTDEMNRFIRVLVLCHTVRVDRKQEANNGQNGASSIYSATGEEYDYQASSPDEKALVEACCRYGVIYHGNNDEMMEVTFHKDMQRFKLLHTLPFDPTRKRMSVIIQDEKGEKTLLCKGAEVAILDRVAVGDVATTQRMIDEYARLGLRTLTIAQRTFTEAEYETLNESLVNAKRSLTRREELLSEVYNELEQHLTLLGATAVEDKLQEAVPETIEALRLAGIKVWVLTGDKEETAVNISHSAGHFNSEMTEMRLTQVNSDEQCVEQIRHLLHLTSDAHTEVENPALVIDGQSLRFALQYSDQLFQLCSQCMAVLCCRMSPIQKAKVVALIKNSPDKPVTAAIGDGANDVSMIQEADVGLAIMGKEGRQAVRNSDYAFGKFRFLHRVLLFHGHLFYNRIAVLVQYFFYKNVAFVTSQLLYAIFSYFSQQSLFDPFYLLFYNLTFTSLPILIYGLFEQHKPQEDLLGKPHLYKTVTRNALLSWPEFLKWNALGLWHCLVFFFGYMFLIWDDVSIFSTGKIIGNFGFGSLVYFTCVTTVNLKLMLETNFWCLPMVLSYLFTFAGIIVLTSIYVNFWWPSWVTETHDIYKLLDQLYDTPTAWLAFLLFIVLALLPDFVLKILRDMRSGANEKEGSSSSTGGGDSSSKSVLHQSRPQAIHRHAYDNPVAVDIMPQDANPLPSVEVMSGSPSHMFTTTAEINGIAGARRSPEVPAVAIMSGNNNVNNNITTVSEVKPVILESSHL